MNLLADMGAQPATLMQGLTAATASTDATAPTSTITSPAPSANLMDGSAVSISGNATDSGGGWSLVSRSRPTAATPGTQ